MQPKLKDWKANHNFELVLVTTDSAQEVEDFLGQAPLEATVLLDPDGDVFQKYNVQAIPTDLLIDGNGSVVRSFVGWGGDEFRQLVNWVESGGSSEPSTPKLGQATR